MKKGVYPASVTPFTTKGDIDFAALARLMAWFKAGGCAGVVLAGTNGEGPSLSAVEKRDLVKTAVSLADGLEVVLGIATPSLDEAKWLCKQSAQAGATAVLLMPPGYFREATEEGIALWFEAVLNASPLPVLIYNFPKRTGFAISPETMARLAQHSNMLGLKDSSGTPENIPAYAQALQGTEKLLYVGDETLLAAALSQGWTGSISGAANIVPAWLSQIVAEWPLDQESAETKFTLIEPVLRAIRSTPQPAANKLMLTTLGVLPSPEVRLPLQAATEDQITQALTLVRQITKQ